MYLTEAQNPVLLKQGVREGTGLEDQTPKKGVEVQIDFGHLTEI